MQNEVAKKPVGERASSPILVHWRCPNTRCNKRFSTKETPLSFEFVKLAHITGRHILPCPSCGTAANLSLEESRKEARPKEWTVADADK